MILIATFFNEYKSDFRQFVYLFLNKGTGSRQPFLQLDQQLLILFC